MNLPLVSVIIPAYNAEKFIQYTLESLLDQTYQNLEIIVVNDGSQDNTSKIVRSFSQKDSRIILLEQSNKGVAAARNLGIQQSKGEYIAPIDADDIWFTEKITKQINCLNQADKLVGLVYSWSLGIDEKGNKLEEDYTSSNIEGDVYLNLIAYNFIGNASVPLIRRSCLEKVGGYDANFPGCEDWELYLRIAESYQFLVVPEFLIGYRQLSESMSSNSFIMANGFQRLLKESQKRHPEIPAINYLKSRHYYYQYLINNCQKNGMINELYYWNSKAFVEKLKLNIINFKIIKKTKRKWSKTIKKIQTNQF